MGGGGSTDRYKDQPGRAVSRFSGQTRCQNGWPSDGRGDVGVDLAGDVAFEDPDDLSLVRPSLPRRST